MAQPSKSPLAELILQAAEAHGTRPFLLFGERSLSYGDVSATALEHASILCGPANGEVRRVALQIENIAEYIAFYLGSILSGATVVPIDPRLTVGETAFILRHCSADVLVTDRDGTCVASDATATTRELDERRPPDTDPTEQETSPASIILYTSGSTSDPKGVLLSHAALLANAKAWTRVYEIDATDRLLSMLPPWHCFGTTAVLHTALLCGAAIVIPEDVSPAAVAVAAKRHRASVLIAVASYYRYLAESRAVADTAFTTVTRFLSGGCALSSRVSKRFEERFGSEIHQTYGLTEAGPVVTANPLGDLRPGTVGHALPGIALAVLTDDGKVAPSGAGELCVRGPSTMTGYLDNPLATAEVMKPPGWLRTGDIVDLDATGYVTVRGRLKDLIIRGGDKLYPEEIEEVLCQHPSVFEAAVVGQPDERYGEVPIAMVVLRSGSLETDSDVLRRHCFDRLAKYKVPRHIECVGELPKTCTGKISKGRLRELVSAGR